MTIYYNEKKKYPLSGTIHGNEGSVHEKWPGVRTRLLDNGPIDVQRPSRSARTDTTSKGHGRRAHGSRW